MTLKLVKRKYLCEHADKYNCHLLQLDMDALGMIASPRMRLIYVYPVYGRFRLWLRLRLWHLAIPLRRIFDQQPLRHYCSALCYQPSRGPTIVSDS
jgi:hypothetical protein